MTGQKRRGPLPVDLVRETVEGLGYEFVGMERVVEGSQPVVRIYIDSLGGINVKDCEIVSRKVSSRLDELEDFFEERFFLEVSSPGLERPLFSFRDFARFLEHKVRMNLRGVAGKTVKRTGILRHVTEESVTLRLEDGTETVIPLADVGRAHLVYEPEKPSNPGRGGAAHATKS